MEAEEFKVMTITDFQKAGNTDYVDDDFVVINSLEGIPYSNEAIRLDCFIIAVCIEGRVQVDINGKTYEMREGNVLISPPNTILSHTMISPQHEMRLVGFSPTFLQRVVKMEKRTWDIGVYIHNNPVRHVSEHEKGRSNIFGLYKDLIMAKIEDTPHCYHKEVIRYLFSALFCEMLGNLNEEISVSDEVNISGESFKQADHILRKFIELLSKDYGKHRSVSYFADMLCYTPKHLSKTIKDKCGKSPMELINRSAIEHIKQRLKHSDKSIKEIAEEFNFPNQSFFGKYVKAHTGMSPAQYRKAAEE